MGERIVMEWFEGGYDPHLPLNQQRKGLAVEISVDGEVKFRHAVTQMGDKYDRTDCVKGLFYWMIDNDILGGLDLSSTDLAPRTRQDLPF